MKKEHVDMFRPPGIVEKYDTNLGVKGQIDEKNMAYYAYYKAIQKRKARRQKG